MTAQTHHQAQAPAPSTSREIARVVPTTIQTVQQAKATEHKIANRIDKLEREIDAVSKHAAVDIDALAAGGEIRSGDLADMQAQLRVLGEALTLAQEAVVVATRREAARVALTQKSVVSDLLNERNATARDVSAMLDSAASGIAKLHANGQALVSSVRRNRGRDTLGPEGYVPFDTVELLQVSHLAHLVQVHLGRTVPSWSYERMPPRGGDSFDSSIEAASELVLQELDILVGAYDLDPGDVAAILADQAAQQPEEV